MKKYYIDIKVTGNKTDLKDFLLLCKKIEYLCIVGSSTEIPLHVDGDGSGDLRFDFKGIEVEIDKEKMEKELNTGNKLSSHFIGE